MRLCEYQSKGEPHRGILQRALAQVGDAVSNPCNLPSFLRLCVSATFFQHKIANVSRRCALPKTNGAGVRLRRAMLETHGSGAPSPTVPPPASTRMRRSVARCTARGVTAPSTPPTPIRDVQAQTDSRSASSSRAHRHPLATTIFAPRRCHEPHIPATTRIRIAPCICCCQKLSQAIKWGTYQWSQMGGKARMSACTSRTTSEAPRKAKSWTRGGYALYI